jgi:membrane protein
MGHRFSAGARRAWDFIRFVGRHFLHDRCREHAMVLTYTTLFAVVPMLTVTFAILSAIPRLQHISADMQDFIFRHFIPSSGQVLQRHLENFTQQASHLTIIGSAMLFVTAILMLMTIERAFNRIWRVRQERKGVISFLRYWAVLSLGPLLLGIGFTLSSYVASIQFFDSAAAVVNNLLPGIKLLNFLFTTLAFTLFYVAVPNCKVPLRAGLAGGMFAAGLFELAKLGFAVFIGSFSSYTLVYGAFAALPVFLLWVYLSWCIVLLGVEVTRALSLFRTRPKPWRHPVLALLEVLQLFWQRQQQGTTVSDFDVMTVLGQKEEEIWFQFADILQQQRIIHRTDTGSYVLSRNLDDIAFFGFYRQLPWPLPTPDELEQAQTGACWAQTLQPALLRAHAALEQELQLTLAAIVAGIEETDAN